MRVTASQKLPRDSGESIFAARHQDASQGPLGRCGSGPTCPLEGPRNWRTLPSRHNPLFPGLFPPSFPDPPGSFCNFQEGAAQAGVGEGS